MAEHELASESRSLSTFRLHLLVATSICTACFVAVSGLSVFMPLAVHLNRTDLQDPAVAGIAEHFLYLHAAFWPVVAGSLVSCVASSLFLYRKMVGPLFQYVRCFEALERGDCPDPIVIRKTDYLSSETRALNRMLEAVADRERLRTDSAAEVEAVASELMEPGSGNARISELASRLHNLKGLR